MKDLTLIKLGGSLITDKRGEASSRDAVIERLAGELADALQQETQQRIVLGHGSGSFGHVAAKRAGLSASQPWQGEDPNGISETQAQAAELHRRVLAALRTAGAPAYSQSPSSLLVQRAGRPLRGTLEPLTRALDLHLLPVIYGDVVMDEDWGASICSTEAAMGFVVRRLRRRKIPIRRLLWLGETDGIWGATGETIPRIDGSNYRVVLKSLGEAAGTDVTGGMRLRLSTAWSLARLGINSWIVDGRREGLLGQALRGENVPGTLVTHGSTI